MSYEQIDPIFNAWAKRHGLRVLTEYKDYQVRAVRLHGLDKEFVDIGVDPLNDAHLTVVHIGILRKPRRNSQYNEFPATLEDLDGILEQAYVRAVAWLKMKP